MLRSKVRLVGLALIPAAVVVFGHSSFGEAKGDDCKVKPDGPSPAGLHWYYRVDRANNRHCWYLHEQGMRVHSLTSRSSDSQNDAADEEVRTAPPAPVTVFPPQNDQHSGMVMQQPMVTERPTADFAARWVDLPRSVDLNMHEPVAGSNGYVSEPGVENRQEQLPAALTDVSAENGEPRQNVAAKANFGSISLAGAVILALLLMSEALIRFARTSRLGLPRVHLRRDSSRCSEHSQPASDAPLQDTEDMRPATQSDAISRTQTGVSELQRVLQRAGTGLRPAQSFAPSRSVHRHEHASRARAHSTFARLKSRSFSGMTWAPL
jgi:hypothetical protein